MLTKKEASKLIYHITDYANNRQHVLDYIAGITEKREIQVGDIYLDGYEIPKAVRHIMPGTSHPIITHDYSSYTSNGFYQNPYDNTNKRNLNLSKLYTLTGE